jgi:hypothetical protein
MPVVRRATENNNTTWIPIPETPLARFVLVKPALRLSQTYGNWMVNFGLSLSPDWRARVLPTVRSLPENTQQSDRVFHSPGLSLGFMKDGVYQSTNLIDFMTACFGVKGGKKFRTWIESGGGPPRPLDRDDDKEEIRLIGDWLGWMEGLELYGSIRHEPDRMNPGTVRSRFGGEMPIGSLPNDPEPDYQTLAEGKLRSMMLETKAADEAYQKLQAERLGRPLTAPKTTKVAAPAYPAEEAKEEPAQRFDATGRPVGGEGGNGVSPDDDDEVPF